MKNAKLNSALMAALLLGTGGLAMPALAATGKAAAEWTAWEGQSAEAPRAIYTEGGDQNGALLVCDENGMMRAMLTLQPGSIPALMKRQAAYARASDAVVTVGGEDAATTTFRYTPATKSIETKSHPIAARVFNAAVLGEALRVETKREGTIETLLPKPNDTFRAFAKTCTALRTPEEV